MLGTGESVSKDRISQLAKEVVSGAKSNPFHAAPVFVMQVNEDLIRVQSKSDDTSIKNEKTGTKRSASSPSSKSTGNNKKRRRFDTGEL